MVQELIDQYSEALEDRAVVTMQGDRVRAFPLAEDLRASVAGSPA